MEMVCRNGRMAGVNCGERLLGHRPPGEAPRAGGNEGQRHEGDAVIQQTVGSSWVPGTVLGTFMELMLSKGRHSMHSKTVGEGDMSGD